MTTLWFSKSRRAQTETDYETWLEGGVIPTLNAFDRGDGREVTVILQNRESVLEDKSDTCVECGNDDSTENQSYCMDCLDSGAKELNEGMKSMVRRLTPVEYERLQGFPDGWTECVSDSQRYKQMGNAVTVNVVAWIGGNL